MFIKNLINVFQFYVFKTVSCYNTTVSITLLISLALVRVFVENTYPDIEVPLQENTQKLEEALVALNQEAEELNSLVDFMTQKLKPKVFDYRNHNPFSDFLYLKEDLNRLPHDSHVKAKVKLDVDWLTVDRDEVEASRTRLIRQLSSISKNNNKALEASEISESNKRIRHTCGFISLTIGAVVCFGWAAATFFGRS